VPPFVLGKTVRNLAASEILWEFFAPLAVTLLAKESTSLRVRRIDN
jgi:hypothetical protein